MVYKTSQGGIANQRLGHLMSRKRPITHPLLYSLWFSVNILVSVLPVDNTKHGQDMSAEFGFELGDF